MDIEQMSAYAGLFKDLKDIWSSITGSDRAKVDAVVRKAADQLLADSEQKDFLVKGTDPLPVRLGGYFVNQRIMKAVPRKPIEPCQEFGIVKCRQCGALQDISLPPNSRHSGVKS